MTKARSASLQGRLSGWLAVQTFIGLGAVCAVVYAVTDASMTDGRETELAQQAQVVRHLLAEPSQGAGSAGVVHKLDDFFRGHADLRLMVTNSKGQMLYLSSSVPKATGPLTSSRFQLSSAQFGQRVEVELSKDGTTDAGVLRRLAWTLLACAAGGAVLVSLGAILLVRHALHPVHALVRQIGSMDVGRLGDRLDGDGQADELQPVIAQFNALLDRLEGAYRQMEGFNADVAHELRTPLATLIGECELALGAGTSLNQALDTLGSNLEELHRMSEVVNAMLFLSQAARGAKPRLTAVASLAQLARDVIEFHEAVLLEADLTADVVGDARGNFDAPLLRQALSNLLANATRHADRGTAVQVQIHGGTEQVQLLVVNTGPTISREHLPRLFDRFYRADPSRGDGHLHHGLGLSIVAAIARMHGGAPVAESSDSRTAIGLRLAIKPR